MSKGKNEFRNQAGPLRTINIIESIRRRPGMYLGDVCSSKGAEHAVKEVVANVVDLFLAGKATKLGLTIDGDQMTFEDDGPGLPFEIAARGRRKSRAEVFLTEFHTTPTADEHAPHIHLTSWGVGLTMINALSRELLVDSWRHGQLWRQRFQAGIACGPARVLETGAGRGTKLRFALDPEVCEVTAPRLGAVRSALFHTVHLFPGFRTALNEEQFFSPHGFSELTFFYCDALNIPYGEAEPFHFHARHQDVEIQSAAFGSQKKETKFISWVNGAITPSHGSHVQGFREALERSGWSPRIALIHTVMHDARFAGPTRERLDLPHVRSAVRDALREPLGEFLVTA